MSSDVSVPVLSKQHMSTCTRSNLINKNASHKTHALSIYTLMHNITLPAKGIRNGSVQNIPRRARAIRDVFTAIDSSIGSSGGITEVIINEQLKKSLYLLLVGSSNP